MPNFSVSFTTRANLAALPAAAAMGYYAKRGYHGPAADWVHDSLGGVFYELFWCVAVAIVLPRWSARRIAGLVLATTCVLEFLQLWHPPVLEAARSHFLGRTILGSFFDWHDFLYYFAGSAIGWVWLRLIRRAG